MALADNKVVLAPTGSTGTGRKFAKGFARVPLVAIEFVVEAVGATPTVTFTIQALRAGGDPAVAADWLDTGYVTADSTVAAAKTAITRTVVGADTLYVDGLDKRFYEALAVNISANTNVTFRVTAYPSS